MANEALNTPQFRPAIGYVPQASDPMAGSSIPHTWCDLSNIVYFVDAAGNSSVAGKASNTYKEACRLASAAALATCTYSATALTLTASAHGKLTIDGVDAANGDRVLIKDQVDQTQNGIYVVTNKGKNDPTGAAWIITRAPDCNTSSQFEPGFLTPVAEGSANADSIWEFSANAPFVMDSNNATFAQAPLAITYGATGDMAAAGASSANAGGASLKVARIDHVHAVDVAVVATLTDAQELTNKTLTGQVVKTGLTASGSASNDFSGSTGTFKTSTGAVTLGGDTTVAANKNLSGASGTGAVDLSAMSGAMKTPTSASNLFTFNQKQAAGASVNSIADPGTGAAIPVTASIYVPLTIGAGAETNSITIPSFTKQRISICADTVGGGTRTITADQAINQAGNTHMAFTQARDFIELEAVTVGGALRWQVTANDGVTLT